MLKQTPAYPDNGSSFGDPATIDAKVEEPVSLIRVELYVFEISLCIQMHVEKQPNSKPV